MLSVELTSSSNKSPEERLAIAFLSSLTDDIKGGYGADFMTAWSSQTPLTGAVNKNGAGVAEVDRVTWFELSCVASGYDPEYVREKIAGIVKQRFGETKELLRLLKSFVRESERWDIAKERLKTAQRTNRNLRKINKKLTAELTECKVQLGFEAASEEQGIE